MMERRPNQVYANEATQTAISGGATRICVTSPCGGGKTLMMVDQLEAALEQNKLASLHTLRRMLFDQTAKVLESQGINFGKRASGHETALLRDIQLAMTQTELSKVYRNGDRELHKADIALWDEAHIQKSPATEQIMADYIAAGGVNVGYTATPLDIGNLYDELIVAGTPSELRKTGALVPVIMYGPDEPDLTHIKNYTVGDDLTEAQNVKVMIRPGVYGRVIDHYRRLNPEQLPAVGFAPGVKYSIGFAEKFTEAGIRAAHVDGNDVWLDGEFHPSSPETREMVMEMSRTGEIKILWNRYVLRVGVDAPWLQHGILACVFGSLTSYLQTAGRLARSCEGKPHACVARGTPVLTNRGLVPIQDVTTDDLVWDGISFNSHCGPTCNGTKEVIEWNGLTATPDHKVHTNHGWTTLKTAATRGWRLTQTGVCGKPVRVLDDSDPYDSRRWAEAGSECSLQQVREKVVCKVSSDGTESPSRMQTLHEPLWATLPGMDLPSSAEAVATLQRPQDNLLRALRWPWDRVSFLDRLRRNVLDCCHTGNTDESEADPGQDRQQRTLRAGQSAMGQHKSADEKSGKIYPKRFSLSSLLGSLSRCWIFSVVCRFFVSTRTIGKTDCRPMAEVWDIVNAGPRHRFTASGVLVGNCLQDHGGNWWRHGSVNADRDWSLDLTNRIAVGERKEKLREKTEQEPIVCQNCGMIRKTGKECPGCGHVAHVKSRMVVQIKGDLKPVVGDIYKPRVVKDKPDTQKVWERYYYSQKRAGRTFNQAYAWFWHEEHYWPPKTLPLMPRDLRDWFRCIGDVPRENLT